MDASRFDRLARSLAQPASRRSLGAIAGVLGGLLLALLPEGATDAKGRRGTRRGRRGDRDDARRNRSRDRVKGGGLQAEKKKKGKKKKKTPACPNGQLRCGASCVDASSDVNHCGGCGAACAAEQRCQGGTCTCNGEVCSGCCDGAECRTGDSDALCGANGAVCQECTGGRSCQSGSCVCPTGQHFCAGACVDQRTDERHCGACGLQCDPDEVCRSGVCGVACGATGVCPSFSDQSTCCGEECVDTDNRTAHCGACGNDCRTAQRSTICIFGNCRCGFTGAPCQTDQTCCRFGQGNDADCRNTLTDTQNCGECDRDCGPGANRCQLGSCRCGDGPPCAEGRTCCGNQACFDLQSNASHCGACGNVCQGGAQCINGACQCGSGDSCPTGQTCCGDGVCLDLKTDRNNCGFCGFECPIGQACCNGQCRELLTDIDNCGACGTGCPGDRNSTNSDVICYAGECTITCRGQRYDMNEDVSDGCEEVDEQTNRTRTAAKDLGFRTCQDSVVTTFTGVIYSDSRMHNPEPPGYNPHMNAAPLWYTVTEGGGGNLCLNDVDITLRMAGGTSGCYRLTARMLGGIADKVETALVIDGVARIQSSYPFYDYVEFKVEKICGPPEVAVFEAEFHL